MAENSNRVKSSGTGTIISDPLAVKAESDPKKDLIYRISGSIGTGVSNVVGSLESLQQGTQNLVDNKQLAAANKYIANFGNSISGTPTPNSPFGSLGIGGLAGEGGIIDKASDYVASGLTAALKTSNNAFGNLSQHTGGVLAALNNVLERPLDLNRLGNLTSKLLNTVFPGASTKYNGIIQNLNLDKLAHAPSLLMSSIDNLITAVDDLLAIPIAFVASIYYGAINIIKRIAREINQILDLIMEFIFNFLDNIIPIKEILNFLNQIATLSGQISGIATTFLGTNVVSGYANFVQGFANQINGIIQNPLDLVFAYAPPEVGQIINALNNPETVINKLLPIELTQAFAGVAKMTGYGFNGNMGYSFGEILRAAQGGVVRNLINGFGSQYGILGPLLGGGPLAQSLNYAPQLLAGRWDTGLNDKNRLSQSPYPYTRESFLPDGSINPNARVRRATPII